MKLLLIALPFVLLLAGMPIFLILLVTASLSLVLVMNVPLTAVPQMMFGAIDKFALLAVPFGCRLQGWRVREGAVHGGAQLRDPLREALHADEGPAAEADRLRVPRAERRPADAEAHRRPLPRRQPAPRLRIESFWHLSHKFRR